MINHKSHKPASFAIGMVFAVTLTVKKITELKNNLRKGEQKWERS